MANRRFYAFLAAAYVLTIYTTSGRMRDLSTLVRRIAGDQLGGLVTAGLILILAGVLLFFRERLDRRRILPILAGYAAALWWLKIPEERFHLLQYGLLAVLIAKALPERLRGISRFGLAVGLATLAGIGDELIQWLRPNRVGDVRDVLINCLAALLTQSLVAVLFRGENEAKGRPAYRERPSERERTDRDRLA